MPRLALALLFILLAVPSAARAGTYDVYACRLPDRTPVPNRGWEPVAIGQASSAPTRFDIDDCLGGGGLSARPAPGLLQFGEYVGWTFAAPPGTAITGFSVHRHATWAASLADMSTTAYVSALGNAMPPIWSINTGGGESCLPLGLETGQPPQCAEAGVPNPPDDPSNLYERGDLAIPRLTLGIGCYSMTLGPCATGLYFGSAELSIFDARVTLSEDSPPTVAGKPRLNGSVVTVSTADLGSGVAQLLALVDGRAVTSTDAAATHPGCRPPYLDPVPCPLSFDGSLTLPPQPPGEHTLQVVAVDASGNRGGSTLASFVVPPPPASPQGAWLTAWFVGKDRKMAKTVAYGATARVRGAAMTAAGAPIARAALAVRQLGAGARPQGSVTTDAKGRFAYSVRPAANEVLRFAYPARGGAGSTAVAQLTLRVRAGVKLKTTPSRVRNGTRMRFAGRVLGRGIKQRPLVTIAVLADGPRSLIPVATVRTRANGRFGYAYRFSRIVGPSTYRFVAIVPKQSGFPYVEGRSTVVVVRGRP